MRPLLLLLDEPVSGMNRAERAEIRCVSSASFSGMHDATVAAGRT